HGQVGDLPPATVSEVSFIDPQLDAAQREAVARAVSTPDVCLIQGLPGTGKSRVLTEVLTQLAQRGQRVLLLSPTAAGLDRVLEPLVPRDGVCPVRCLAPGEMVESLPASLRSLTIEGRVRSFDQQTVPAAPQLPAQSPPPANPLPNRVERPRRAAPWPPCANASAGWRRRNRRPRQNAPPSPRSGRALSPCWTRTPPWRRPSWSCARRVTGGAPPFRRSS